MPTGTTLTGFLMFELTSSLSAADEFQGFETVLAHCVKKVGNNDYSQAVAYGRKSGYLNAENKLTVSGRAFAQFAQFDLETAA